MPHKGNQSDFCILNIKNTIRVQREPTHTGSMASLGPVLDPIGSFKKALGLVKFFQAFVLQLLHNAFSKNSKCYNTLFFAIVVLYLPTGPLN